MSSKIKLFLLVLLSSQCALFSQKDSTLIKSLLDTAFVYERLNYEKSFNAAKEALSLSEKANYPTGISTSHRQMGLIYYNKGDYDKAITEFITAIKIADKNNLSIEQAKAYLHIGLVYLELKKFDLAMNYFMKGKKICEINNIDKGLPSFYTNIGICYDQLNMDDSALYYFNSTRDFYFKNKNYGGMASVENNIGNLLKQQGKYKAARPHYADALKYTKQIEDMYTAVNYSNIAEIDSYLGNFPSALAYIDSAVSTSKDFGSNMTLMVCLTKKQAILELQGNYKASNECYKDILALKDSMLNQNVQEGIAEIQTKYESEKKEAENKLLKQANELNELKIKEDQRKTFFLFVGLGLTVLMLIIAFYAYRIKIKTNKILSNQNEQINKQNETLKKLNFQLIEGEEALQESNTAKDKLLSVISHDISNPVKALSNYTNAVISDSDKMSKEELNKALQAINNTVVPLQSMVENLLNWSQIQKNGLNPHATEFSLNKLLQECIFIYQNTCKEKGIKITQQVPEDALINADKDMMQIIVRNLLSNAIKFSPPHSEININFGNKHLSVSDKGKGMSASLAHNILSGENHSSEYGTENEKGIGMGLQLVRDCILAQGFNWKIDSEIGKGTTFNIEL